MLYVSKNLPRMQELRDAPVRPLDDFEKQALRALEQGQELGRFNMGSTVILLFQKDRARWHDDLRAGATVRLGQSLGYLE